MNTEHSLGWNIIKDVSLIVLVVLTFASSLNAAMNGSFDVVGGWALTVNNEDTGSTISFVNDNGKLKGEYVNRRGQKTNLEELRLDGMEIYFRVGDLEFNMVIEENKIIGFVLNKKEQAKAGVPARMIRR